MKRQIQAVFVFQAIALAIAACFFRHALNTDAVAYLQLARHYADGHFSLAISGHWSPFISWAVALILKLGLPPLAAARLFMIFSGVAFLYGSLRLFRQFELSPSLLLSGLWTMALLSVPWSVENITPDLLMAGLAGLAISQMATAAWWQKPGLAFWCGAIWGLTFLCKSPALPLGILTVTAGAFWWSKYSGTDARRKVVCAFALSVAGICVFSAPWIAVLTAHYGKITVANSASYNHSLIYPDGSKRLFLLDCGVQVPPAGRLTTWEDPTAPYPNWSPFSSAGNAIRQLHIIGKNIPIALAMITSVSLVFPVVGVVALLCLVRRADKIFWLAFLPVLILAGLFLPNFLLISEQRYFYAVAPLLFIATVHYLHWFTRRPVLLAFCFLLPNFARVSLHLGATRTAGDCAFTLAKTITQKNLAGSVVGSGKISGGRMGLNIAWLLQQPWFGDEPVPTAADYKASGASLLVVNRRSAMADDLLKTQNAQNLDPELFDSASDAEQCPVQIFQVSNSAQ